MMELSARMGSLVPYRKAADVLAEFLPIPSTESFIRHSPDRLRIPTKPAMHSNMQPAACVDLKPAGAPI